MMTGSRARKILGSVLLFWPVAALAYWLGSAVVHSIGIDGLKLVLKSIGISAVCILSLWLGAWLIATSEDN